MKSLLLALIVVSLVSLAACGGGTGISVNPQTYQIGGTVTGLAAPGGLVLQDNSTDDLTISQDGNFHFATPVSSYRVTVSTQPSGQTCTVANGTGTATAQVTNVTVTCIATPPVTIAVVVSGLTSANTGMMIENNGQNPQPVNGNNTYDLTVPSGSAYAITVSTQPLNATCAVANGTGTANSNVTVTITCTPTVVGDVNISVVVSGLTQSMTGLVLINNGNTGNPLDVNGNGTSILPVAAGSPYAITVLTQPTGGTCTVTNGSGTANSNVTVTVTCSGPLTLSATTSGLSGTLVLQDDKGDALTYTGNTTQTFATSYASGATYTVSVKTQPTGQTCTLSSNATGTITANTTVTATCSSTNYTISASVTGLAGTLVLQDDKSDNLTFTSSSTQTFATSYASGSIYTVSIKTQPTGQTCALSSNATGTITGNITVTATCTTNTYTISAQVTGLTGTLVLQDNGGDNLTFTTNSTASFATKIPYGGAYAVTVLTQPTGQSCSLGSNANGTATANVTVTVTCTTSTPTYTISVAVTGLTGTLIVQDSKSESLTFTSNKTQTFPTPYASGSTYSVTITTQPTGQTCTLSSNASGTITSNITVNATCTTNVVNYTISVAVTGLTGTLVMQDDKADTLTFTTNTTQTFATQYASGSTYTVSVKTQPTGQTCTLSSNASGTITGNVTVTATCTTNVTNYTISVAVTGLTGTLVVQDSKSESLTFTSNKTQTFPTSYASGSTYSVTITTQPTGQTCTLSSNASGTITSNITVNATCVSNYTISVAVTGLTGTLVMQDDKSDTLTFTTNNTQTFATSYASGSTYSVTVRTQPTGQTCTLSSNASGTITGNITVTATCAPSGGGLTVSVNVTGLSGSVTVENELGSPSAMTFTKSGTQTFSNTYTSGATYTVYVTLQPTGQSCIPTYSTGTITSNVTINAVCATGSTRALGTVSGVSTIACQGGIKNGVCQQMTVACPGVPNVLAFVKTNAPTGAPLGTVTYGTGTDGNGLYESIFTFGSTAVQNVLNAGFTTVQISWGTPFNTTQPDGWVLGPGGVLATACRYATVTQWIYTNIQKSNTSIPYCATANSGGAGALAYALSQYPSSNVLSMAEVTSGPPPGRLDWGCGCQEGKMNVQCGSSTSLGTCFGTADGPVWDPAYNPTSSTGVCTNAVTGNLPPGGLNFFLGDSVEAPGAAYTFPKTFVNLVFGGADNSSAIPIGQDWFNNISTNKAQVCVPNGQHSLANTLAGAQQIANDLINFCKLQ